MNRQVLLILAFALLSATSATADYRRICRGTSYLQHEKEIKKAVQTKLSASGVTYTRVTVKIKSLQRSTDSYQPDFSGNISLNSGSTPSVSFSGSFAAVSTCTVTAALRILAVFPTGRTLTITPISIPGVMLTKPADIANSPDAD